MYVVRFRNHLVCFTEPLRKPTKHLVVKEIVRTFAVSFVIIDFFGILLQESVNNVNY